ncbi:MAG: hypothetical protein J2P13_07535 [Acidobacteria bacterium]|nr:hypothetical protein [Acidobacteriota bacterium]
MTVLTQSPSELEIVREPQPSARGDFDHFPPGVAGLKKAATSFLAVLAMALVGVQFAFTIAHPDFDDPDIWWHMRNAQYLLERHHLMRQDMYSFTVPGKPWVNSEWLAEVPYYLAYRGFGLSGLKAMTFILASILMLLLLYLCYQESRNFKASVAACCGVTLLALASYGPRTILFGYIFLVLLLIILQRFRARAGAPLWTIPPLFCLWANTHGSWALGLVLFFLAAVAGLVGGSWGRIESSRWNRPQILKLSLTGAAAVAALFLNPYGWRLVNYPFDLAFHQKLNVSHVIEWASVNFQDLRGSIVFVVIAALFAAALLGRSRWNLGGLMMLVFALHTALAHVRFVVLLGIVAAPMLAKLLDFFPPYRPELDTPRLNVAVMLAAMAAMAYLWPRESAVQSSLAKAYPTGVVSYFSAHPPHGNVLNFYLWGGFLEWNAREVKTFVDSRVDIFEYAGVFEDYLDLLGSDSLLRRIDPIIEKYNIRYVLFPPGDSTNKLLGESGVAYLLEHDPRWRILYRDGVSVLLERLEPASLPEIRAAQ